jgi:hypothetical protein
MWRTANVRRWVAAFRRHPAMGLAGFAVGLLYGAATTFFDRLSGHGMRASTGIFANMSPIATALVGIAIFVWLSGTLRLPQKRGMVFVVCIFPGAMVELLLRAIIGTIARTIA